MTRGAQPCTSSTAVWFSCPQGCQRRAWKAHKAVRPGKAVDRKAQPLANGDHKPQPATSAKAEESKREGAKKACVPPPPRKIPAASGPFPTSNGHANSPSLAGPQPSGARVVAPPQRIAAATAVKPARKNIDYSKFDNIEDSDDEDQKASQAVLEQSKRPTFRIIQMPTEAVSITDFRAAFEALLQKAKPQTVVPDIESMYKSFVSCPDTTDRALLDQACHAVEEVPFSAMRHGEEGWKSGTTQMTQAMVARQRYDEARMWCVIRSLRMPKELEPLHMHAWCLEEMWTQVLNSEEKKVRRHSWQGAKLVDKVEYAEELQAVLRLHLERSIELGKDSKNIASYAGLAASLERSGQIEQARKVGKEGVRRGVWVDEWQRPAHYVRNLQPCKPWHETDTLEMCAALEHAMPSIKQEFDRYVKDGGAFKDVGIRSGEAMLVIEGSYKEVPLFNAGRMDHEVCSKFPETVRILTERCADATGLAFCGGGEVAFRILSPGSKLKPHCGPTNARLTCQLGISVPLGAEPGLVVAGQEARVWSEGRCAVFDDSYENYEELDELAEGDCVVFLVHFWHPAFQHKNDPDWKMKNMQDFQQEGAAEAPREVSAPYSDLPPID